MKKYYIVDNHVLYSTSLLSILRSRKNEVIVDHGQNGPEHIHREIIIYRPDFIVTEIAFPQFYGIELLHRLQESSDTNEIPMIVYTAASNRKQMAISFDKGADHFFIKEDFPPHVFIERLEKLYLRLN